MKTRRRLVAVIAAMVETVAVQLAEDASVVLAEKIAASKAIYNVFNHSGSSCSEIN